MGERKFKVGDLICGTSDAPYSITNVKMTLAKVVKVDDDVDGMTIKILKHKSYDSDTEFSVKNTEKYFKLVKAASEDVIVIYRKENKVIAHNKATGEKAIAKCSPEDTFDFNIGAKLAFERLMSTRRIVKLDKYEIGDKVKIVDAWTDKTWENSEGLMDKYLGTVMTIRDITQKGKYKMHEDKTDFDGDGWFWNEHCIEGKVVEDTEVKEVKRHAKIGEYIKVVHAKNPMDYYENGDVLKVTHYFGSEEYGSVNTINLRTNSNTIHLDADEYVVLEGYVPTEDIKVEEPKKEEPPFKVGDTVEMLVDLCGVPKGVRGTVVKVTYDLVVDFHVAYSGTHKANDLLPNKTGLYVLFEHVKKVN